MNGVSKGVSFQSTLARMDSIAEPLLSPPDERDDQSVRTSPAPLTLRSDKHHDLDLGFVGDGRDRNERE